MQHVSPSIVRIATMEDYPEITRLFLQYHNESAHFSLDYKKIDWIVARLLNPEIIARDDIGTRGVMGVIGPVGALEGVVAVIISTPWYSSQRVLNDLALYVDPHYRASSHAKAMIEWMKEQSRVTNIPLISGVVATERTEAKVRLFRRQMPVKMGEYFYYDPKSSIVTSSGVGIEGHQMAGA